MTCPRSLSKAIALKPEIEQTRETTRLKETKNLTQTGLGSDGSGTFRWGMRVFDQLLSS